MTFDDHTQTRKDQDAALLDASAAYQRKQAESAERVRRYRLAIRRIDAILIASVSVMAGAGAMLLILRFCQL